MSNCGYNEVDISKGRTTMGKNEAAQNIKRNVVPACDQFFWSLARRLMHKWNSRSPIKESLNLIDDDHEGTNINFTGYTANEDLIASLPSTPGFWSSYR
ncbi:hypothetical protein PHYBLDRAFT_150079 [Phycomyces blakesleeanus NRRL 1555(-)]|uniref:Uncharacterized protein n=1 Tax=Phycomyces blakesleeanus (strain ATCC 8743b / DSM 1359 / FGSC 10004 / NBRC 33097 / NRRL 1555) TaxID=763407 RepID=A0A162WMK0_PHYB8|nr:hypothetical protein PHYBLDRAFT_150079 [Phycomyces blakesleeanus NRRL 1555(-)]OAD69085.1 hypothetical protein PHYBLDRAFT_150079 [Phycomyces blakesleeanus NRRL 1555(-)]|eukprot:XP_018287125.1 hypothetical protein PHYBLDRAFT_150079 [Phycomyces blakesleeanus NRRL 1555(-)]